LQLILSLAFVFLNQLTKNEKPEEKEESENLENLEISEISEDSNQILYRHFKFIHAFLASLSVILVSELGDKTFFIAAIMAMKHNRWTVFSAAILALIIMTLLSVVLGLATTIIPRDVVRILSLLLFFGFGIKMLKEAYYMSNDEGKEEYEEIQMSLNKQPSTTDVEYNVLGAEDPETGVIRTVSSVPFLVKVKRKCMIIFSLIFIETFSMIFLAEWGDRSQVTTIILAAREDPIGITLGAIIGHTICTSVAVIGGRFVAQLISVKTVTLIGGIVFISFGLSSLILGTIF